MQNGKNLGKKGTIGVDVSQKREKYHFQKGVGNKYCFCTKLQTVTCELANFTLAMPAFIFFSIAFLSAFFSFPFELLSVRAIVFLQIQMLYKKNMPTYTPRYLGSFPQHKNILIEKISRTRGSVNTSSRSIRYVGKHRTCGSILETFCGQWGNLYQVNTINDVGQ